MGLARKLLNKSISFEKKKIGLDKVLACWGGVHNDGKIILEYQIPINKRDTETVTQIITPKEYVEFLTKAVNLQYVTFFGGGEGLLYKREEILWEIKERGTKFFTNDDEKAGFPYLIEEPRARVAESISETDENSQDTPNPSREDDSQTISDEKMDDSPLNDNTQQDNTPTLGILRMPKIKRS